MKFEFTTASRIIFGPGSIRELALLASSLGKRALVVTNLPDRQLVSLTDQLTTNTISFMVYKVSNEPTIETLVNGVEQGRNGECDYIIGVGGGSAMDTGKAIALFMTNPGEVVDYLEVVGRGCSFTKPPLPCIAIPTTAGTGAEVTRNSVVGVPEKHVKVSLRSSFLLPKIAVVDPELTYGLPPSITASTGFDAFTQLVEAYVSVKANPITDAFCVDGISRIKQSFLKAYISDDKKAREEMALASLYGGLALTNSGLGIVHGFASVLGGMYHIPHGVICALLLPFAIKTNIQALQRRNPKSVVLDKFKNIARILTGEPNATLLDGLAWIQDLWAKVFTISMSNYGVSELDFPTIVEKTQNASSTKSNPILLEPGEMMEILLASFT